jgi:hypothetical protein
MHNIVKMLRIIAVMLPPNPPILGDFRTKTVSKSPRIGGFRGPALEDLNITD